MLIQIYIYMRLRVSYDISSCMHISLSHKSALSKFSQFFGNSGIQKFQKFQNQKKTQTVQNESQLTNSSSCIECNSQNDRGSDGVQRDRSGSSYAGKSIFLCFF